MNLAVLQLAGKYPKLLGLSDMLGMSANQLTPKHVVRIADAFGVVIPFNDEVVQAFIAMLKGHNIHQVSDLIQSPESVGEIVAFIRGGFNGVSNLKEPEIGFKEDALSLFHT